MESTDPEYDQLIAPIMNSCRLFGCWPDSPEKTRIPGHLHRMFVLTTVTILTLGTTAEVIQQIRSSTSDMNDTIECSLIASALYMAILRIVVFSTNQRSMLYVVDTMRDDWKFSRADDRSLIRDRCGLAFKLAKLFIGSVAVASCSFVVMPVVEMKAAHHHQSIDHQYDINGSKETRKILPFRGYYFFDHNTSPRYEYIYILNSIIGIFGCSTIAGATSFSLIATIHGAAKFAVIQREFENMRSIDWTIDDGKIHVIVGKHLECIRFAEKVESIINFLALAQFVISTGLMCFAGFQLTTMLKDRTRLMKYATFLQSAIMELFIFSYSGQKLKTESESIADYAYLSDWIGASSPTNIKLISMRSRKPCTITAGKFYDMSLETFLKVLSSSFSYFTVLLAMKDE